MWKTSFHRSCSQRIYYPKNRGIWHLDYSPALPLPSSSPAHLPARPPPHAGPRRVRRSLLEPAWPSLLLAQGGGTGGGGGSGGRLLHLEDSSRRQGPPRGEAGATTGRDREEGHREESSLAEVPPEAEPKLRMRRRQPGCRRIPAAGGDDGLAAPCVKQAEAEAEAADFKAKRQPEAEDDAWGGVKKDDARPDREEDDARPGGACSAAEDLTGGTRGGGLSHRRGRIDLTLGERGGSAAFREKTKMYCVVDFGEEQASERINSFG